MTPQEEDFGTLMSRFGASPPTQETQEALLEQRDALVLKVARQERQIASLKAELRKLHRREHERQASERRF